LRDRRKRQLALQAEMPFPDLVDGGIDGVAVRVEVDEVAAGCALGEDAARPDDRRQDRLDRGADPLDRVNVRAANLDADRRARRSAVRPRSCCCSASASREAMALRSVSFPGYGMADHHADVRGGLGPEAGAWQRIGAGVVSGRDHGIRKAPFLDGPLARSVVPLLSRSDLRMRSERLRHHIGKYQALRRLRSHWHSAQQRHEHVRT
jgi:hypothetical protein